MLILLVGPVCLAQDSSLQTGITIGVLNVAKELRGIQIGLLNYAANNPPPFRWLPVLNLNLGRN